MPRYRGRGIAGRALRRCDAVLRAHGAGGLRIPTWWSWQPAVRFYLGLGFWVANWKHELTFTRRQDLPPYRILEHRDVARLEIWQADAWRLLIVAENRGERLGWHEDGPALARARRSPAPLGGARHARGGPRRSRMAADPIGGRLGPAPRLVRHGGAGRSRVQDRDLRSHRPQTRVHRAHAAYPRVTLPRPGRDRLNRWGALDALKPPLGDLGGAEGSLGPETAIRRLLQSGVRLSEAARSARDRGRSTSPRRSDGISRSMAGPRRPADPRRGAPARLA